MIPKGMDRSRSVRTLWNHPCFLLSPFSDLASLAFKASFAHHSPQANGFVNQLLLRALTLIFVVKSQRQMGFTPGMPIFAPLFTNINQTIYAIFFDSFPGLCLLDQLIAQSIR
jgi:hypothetical protein